MMFLWFCHIDAQCNYSCFIQAIDSLKTSLMSGATVKVPKNYWNFNDLSIEERNQVLDYIETLYNQTEYMSFYHLGINLLVDLFENDDKNVQDRIARLYLDKAYYVFRDDLTNLGKVTDYSDETKERLKNILERNKTEEDILARKNLAKRDVKREHKNEISKSVKKIMQETDRKGEQIELCLIDSLTDVYVNKKIQRMEEYPPLEKYTILQIGSSNDQRFVAGLEKILATDYAAFCQDRDCKSWESLINSIKEACVYALAKLGVRQYLDTVYAQKDFHYEYLGTADALLKFIERNFDWNTGARRCSVCGVLPQPLMTAFYAVRCVKNVPKDVHIGYLETEVFIEVSSIKDYDPSKDEQNQEIIQKVKKLYQWFFDNKDNLEMQPASDRY
jgi:hypothetical protein